MSGYPSAGQVELAVQPNDMNVVGTEVWKVIVELVDPHSQFTTLTLEQNIEVSF